MPLSPFNLTVCYLCVHNGVGGPIIVASSLSSRFKGVVDTYKEKL